MKGEYVMIIVGVPAQNADTLLEAMALAGGGELGNYTHCASISASEGRFRPNADANPRVGEKEATNHVPELRIESFCEREKAGAVVNAVRKAHPYEEPVIYVIPLLSENDLPRQEP